MTARNDITGDKLKSKQTNQNYLDNFDLIFRKTELQSDDNQTIRRISNDQDSSFRRGDNNEESR